MWTQDEIDVKRLGGELETLKVQRYGLWAISNPPNCGWILIHVPTGLQLPFSFASEMGVKKAAEEVAALRNNWDITPEDLTPEESTKMGEICARYAAVGFVGGEVGVPELINPGIVKRVNG